MVVFVTDTFLITLPQVLFFPLRLGVISYGISKVTIKVSTNVHNFTSAFLFLMYDLQTS